MLFIFIHLTGLEILENHCFDGRKKKENCNKKILSNENGEFLLYLSVRLIKKLIYNAK